MMGVQFFEPFRLFGLTEKLYFDAKISIGHGFA